MTSFVLRACNPSRGSTRPVTAVHANALASTTSHPTFVTTRDRPSCRNRMAIIKQLIWGFGKAEICPSCQFVAWRRANDSNRQKVEKIVGRRTFTITITRPPQQEAEWTYSEIRRMTRERNGGAHPYAERHHVHSENIKPRWPAAKRECSEFTSAFGSTADMDGLSAGSAPSRMTRFGSRRNDGLKQSETIS